MRMMFPLESKCGRHANAAAGKRRFRANCAAQGGATDRRNLARPMLGWGRPNRSAIRAEPQESTPMIRPFTAALFATSLLCAPAFAQSVSPAIAAAVADAARPDTDKERDATRKPAETVAFAGVKSGMTVAELGPGRGYYTRILAKAVGPKGKVYAVVTAAQAARPGVLDGLNALAAT